MKTTFCALQRCGLASPGQTARRLRFAGFGIALVSAFLVGVPTATATPDDNAKIRAKAKKIDWETLSDLDYETGKKPAALTKRLAKPVKIRGYAIPLEAGGDGVTSFLLVSDPMFCAHVPPPPPNQLILVELPDPLPWRVFEQSLWLSGTLVVVDQQSDFGGFMYQMKHLAGLEKGGW
ncbi:MAG: DUF3299 domain-containing protein [Myxococcota bacterium]